MEDGSLNSEKEITTENPLEGRVDNEVLLNMPDEVKHKINILMSDVLPLWIQIFGWIYFALSFIGGIALISGSSEKHYVPSSNPFSSGEYVTTVNYFYYSLGIVGIITSSIVLLICMGIARTIKQNIYIIQKLEIE